LKKFKKQGKLLEVLTTQKSIMMISIM